MWRRNDENVSKSRQHERAEGVVNHGLVVDGQQLLRHSLGYGVEARAATSSQDDSLHLTSLEALLKAHKEGLFQ